MKPVRNVRTKANLFNNMSFNIKCNYRGLSKAPYINHKGELIYNNQIIAIWKCNKLQLTKEIEQKSLKIHNSAEKCNLNLSISDDIYFTFDFHIGAVKIWDRLSGKRISTVNI